MHVYSIPMRARFRGITRRTGLLFEGPAGWGEFCPFEEYDDDEAMAWLACALEAANEGWPAPVRSRIPVNCTVPVVGPEQAHEIVARSGCSTAKVKVAESTLAEDCARLEAVRDALGPQGFVRVDANMMWDVDTAVTAIKAMDRAAGGLQYVEQPCHTLDELAEVRRKVTVPIAADESIRKAEDPLKVAVSGAADIAVIKVAPLGGVRRALEVAEACGLPCVVSSALETSVGMAAGIALAAALPQLDHACGLATLQLLDGDVTSDSLVPVDGYLPVLAKPPVPDRITEFESADAAWTARYERVLAKLRA
ncbi:o-succinylbenzoate synthase [Lentzea sp. NPDC004789]